MQIVAYLLLADSSISSSISSLLPLVTCGVPESIPSNIDEPIITMQPIVIIILIYGAELAIKLQKKRKLIIVAILIFLRFSDCNNVKDQETGGNDNTNNQDCIHYVYNDWSY